MARERSRDEHEKLKASLEAHKRRLVACLRQSCDRPNRDEEEDTAEDTLREMKLAVLRMVEDVLKRLEKGVYGYCSECETKIAKSRLRALPFAVRCKNCEEGHETLHRAQNQRRPIRSFA